MMIIKDYPFKVFHISFVFFSAYNNNHHRSKRQEKKRKKTIRGR